MYLCKIGGMLFLAGVSENIVDTIDEHDSKGGENKGWISPLAGIYLPLLS